MKVHFISRKLGVYSRLLWKPSRYYSVSSGGNIKIKQDLALKMDLKLEKRR